MPIQPNKVAFISYGHSGSTLPLIKRFLQKGYYVDYYVYTLNGFVNNLEGTDCVFSPKHKGIEEIPSGCWPKLLNYIESDKFRLLSITGFRPFSSVWGIRSISSIFQRILIKNACKIINSKHYCFINIIGRHTVSDIKYYVKWLKGNVVVSLHEVCDHMSPNFRQPNDLMAFLFNQDTPIVVFSKKSFNDICKYNTCNSKNVHLINFGPFESFSIYKNCNTLRLPEHYFLFIGRLSPYKGIDVFVQASNNLEIGGFKYVIAGSGHSEELVQTYNNPNFIVINRYLKEFEFAELIEKASCVVCPYTSVSQSGIPQTVAVFHKPIIASDLPGFNELIINGVNGFLFPVNDVKELSKLLVMYSKNKELQQYLNCGASKFNELFEEYSWDHIINLYIQYFLFQTSSQIL